MPHFGWKPYVPVAKRRAKADREMKKLAKQGRQIEPVVIDGTKIARTFWGEAWCKHLEQYSDYANRLPRGRTYVRNGSVCHLSVGKGKIEAVVSGSELYQVAITIEPLPAAKWKRLREQCTGQIGSLLELLHGRFSNQVMQIVTHRDQGLFPNPTEIHTQCSCPDWAGLCKHLAAVLYGVGARLDQQPELLFRLRGVDHQELITADLDPTRAAEGAGKGRRLATDDLSEVFGIDLDDEFTPAPRKPPATRKQTVSKAPTATAEPPFAPTGPAIAQLRERLDMNKSQFARLVGVSPPTITNWERKAGAIDLHPDHLKCLRRVSTLTESEAATRLVRARR
ncbi:MAG: zinc finger, domain protein [Chromatiaceae bacterium]|nr:zinc finger, domain protein [Chromatiaceae bacterium]